MADYILQTKKEIREKTAYFISFNLFLLVFLLVELKILSSDTIQNLSLLSGIFAAGFSILVFFGDFYRTLERVLTGRILGRILGRYFEYTTSTISEYIFKNLTIPCEGCRLNLKEDNELKREDFSRIMSLFYKFIPSDHTERERSFAYFTDYYLAINYLIISALFFIISVIVLVILYVKQLVKTTSLVTLGILVIYLATFCFSLFLCRRYSSRLISPTQNQIHEILTTKRDELISLLPEYRVYKINIDKNGYKRIITCAEAGKCPLIKRKSDYHDIL